MFYATSMHSNSQPDIDIRAAYLLGFPLGFFQMPRFCIIATCASTPGPQVACRIAL
jgi:hypothetical protein